MNHDLADSIPLDAALIHEVTDIVFGPLVEPIACDVIFIFGGLDPGLWEKGAEAYSRGLGKHVVVTGGYKPTAATPYWKDGTRVIRRPCSSVVQILWLGYNEHHNAQPTGE